MSPDPLVDTLFRSTTVEPAIVASAAPVRAVGTRSRAGNAMSRTRIALLDGAGRAVQVNGTRITMAQVAAAAGVAKATLYNHFRTRDAVLCALLLAEVQRLVDDVAELPLEQALDAAAVRIATHPLPQALARLEPATLAAIARVDGSNEGWAIARAAIETALATAGRGGTDTVLRWLASYLVNPAGRASVAADLAILLGGLPSAPRTAHRSVEPGAEARPA